MFWTVFGGGIHGEGSGWDLGLVLRTSCTSCASLGSSGFRIGSLRRIQILMSLIGSEASTPAFFPPTVFITAANSTTTAANSKQADRSPGIIPGENPFIGGVD